MLAAASTDLGDHFSFNVERSRRPSTDDGDAVARYRVAAEMAGRIFEYVVIDVGPGFPPLPTGAERLPVSNLLGYAGFPPTEVPVVPLTHHVAEKVPACTRIFEGGRPGSRTKDLVDLLLIRGMPGLRRGLLKSAIDETFRRRGIHPVPARLPTPPDAWAMPYGRLVEALDLDPDLATGHRDVAAFLDPVLAQAAPDDAVWNPVGGAWSR